METISPGKKLLGFLSQELNTRFNRILLATTLLYWLAVQGAAHFYGGGVTMTNAVYNLPLQIAFAGFFIFTLLWRILYIMIVKRPRHLFAAIGEDFRALLSPRRLVMALPVFIFMPFFFSLFTSAKNLIPLINPFYLDPFFAQAERLIHFGRQPWEWLHPVLGFAAVTSVISLVYKTWFLMKYGVCFWQAFATKRPRLREQFLLSFLFSWVVLGTVFALLLSSGGPCYFGLLYPEIADPYAELMAYLRKANEIHPVYELHSMDYLWQSYAERKTKIFSGISAMPSMHISVALLFVLLGWRVNRAMGILFTAYFLVIFVGSVHLGWHYALDGYVSVIVTFIIWRITGLITGRDEKSRAA